MLELVPIKVECHSGYKADEYPKSFNWNGKILIVEEILDRWYQVDRNPETPVSNYFKVRTDSGEKLIIKHDIELDKWFLCQSS